MFVLMQIYKMYLDKWMYGAQRNQVRVLREFFLGTYASDIGMLQNSYTWEGS